MALTKTLTSLNETKNTLESRFQHDKKELLDQIDNLKVKLMFFDISKEINLLSHLNSK